MSRELLEVQSPFGTIPPSEVRKGWRHVSHNCALVMPYNIVFDIAWSEELPPQIEIEDCDCWRKIALSGDDKSP